MNKLIKWVPLLVMSLALTIIILDSTILNVTLRTIIGDLNTTIQKIQWVITAYSLMLAAFTITGGRLGDLFGRKKMFVIGAVIFAVGSFMASIAHTVSFMILGEAIIEGIGAALMMPATASLLRSTYKGRDLQVAFGIWGGIIAGAAALGPVVGGWFTTHYSWRWAFRINVVVAAVLVLASVLIKEYRETEEKPSIDFLGVILSSLGMLSIVFGFIQSSVYGWLHEKAPLIVMGHIINLNGASATPFFVLLGLLILTLFLAWETYSEDHGRTPLVSMSLFKNKTFVTGTSVSSLLALGQAGLGFSIPVYLQAVLKLDPIHTGIAMIPMTAVILVAAPTSAWISKFIAPKRIIQMGILVDAIGFLVLRQSLHVGASAWSLAPGFALFGLGAGFMMAQVSNLTLSAVSVEQSGEASGVSNTARSLGQTLGSAVIGAIMLSALASNVTSGINSSAVIPAEMKPQINKVVAAQSSNIEFGNGANLGTISSKIANEITAISNKSTVDANKTALGYGTLLILLAFWVSFMLPTGEIKEEHAIRKHEPPGIDKNPKKEYNNQLESVNLNEPKPVIFKRNNMSNIIEVANLTKKYGDFTAVEQINFQVKEGEIFGILGPNGAGKTTTLEMVEGLKPITSGEAHLDGHNVRTETRTVKSLIGVQLQSSSFFRGLNLLELIDTFAALYGRTVDAAKLLADVQLTEKAKSEVMELSGGQKQRLSIAVALVNDPKVLFLDEPTTGLDPQARRNLWDLITRINHQGKTIVLTTHYLDEAEVLCDRIAIMDHAKIIAMDTTENLLKLPGLNSSIEFRSNRPVEVQHLQHLPGVIEARVEEHRYHLTTTSAQQTMSSLFMFAQEQGMVLNDVQLRQPNLEDVFLKLTGHGLRE